MIVLSLTTRRLNLTMIANIYNRRVNKMRYVKRSTYLVTLNTLSSLTQRNTDIPKGGITFVFVKIISAILPITTKQSKRLNNDTK